MALLFCEREFQDAWRELDKPQVGDGWELFAQTTGVDIYRHYVQDSGLYEYKVFGSLSTTPELCADVYMDLGYRKQWDSYVKDQSATNHAEGPVSLRTAVLCRGRTV